MAFLRKYGTQTTLNFPLIKRDAVDFAVAADYTFASGDCKVKKDEGASASSTNSLAHEGEGTWSLVLTATEMQAARIVVTVVDSATKAVEDQCVIIETFGHASAQFAVDLSDSVRAGLTALPNAAAEAAGGLYTRGTGAGQLSQTANGELGVATLAKTLTTYTGNTPQTGDAYAIVNSGTHGNAALKTLIDTVDNFVDTEVAAILAAVDTEVAAIKAVTDALPDSGALTSLATASALATVDTVVDAIKVTTDKLDDTLEDDAGTYRFTENSLEQAPGGGAGTTDWDADERTAIRTILGIPASGTTPDAPTAGALKVIDDFLDTEIASILSAVDTEVASIITTLGTPAGASVSADLLVIDNLVDDLESRLTALRAGYLDNLSAGAVALESTAQGILTDTAEIGAAGAGLTALATQSSVNTIDDFLDTEVAAILAAVDTEVAAIKVVTDAIGATGSGLSAIPWNASWDAEVQSEVTDALSAAATEAYRSTGATGSVFQLLYEILGNLINRSASGTTVTVTKLDKSTTAKTYQFDDATTPTAIEELT